MSLHLLDRIIKEQINGSTCHRLLIIITAWFLILLRRCFLGVKMGKASSRPTLACTTRFSNSWRYVDSLTSPRAGVAVATIDDYSIIVVGGYTKGHGSTAAKLSSLPLVEIGQAELAWAVWKSHMNHLCVRMYVHMCVYRCVRMYVCRYNIIFISIIMYLCMYARIYVCMYLCIIIMYVCYSKTVL